MDLREILSNRKTIFLKEPLIKMLFGSSTRTRVIYRKVGKDSDEYKYYRDLLMNQLKSAGFVPVSTERFGPGEVQTWLSSAGVIELFLNPTGEEGPNIRVDGLDRIEPFSVIAVAHSF